MRKVVNPFRTLLSVYVFLTQTPGRDAALLAVATITAGQSLHPCRTTAVDGTKKKVPAGVNLTSPPGHAKTVYPRRLFQAIPRCESFSVTPFSVASFSSQKHTHVIAPRPLAKGIRLRAKPGDPTT